MAPSDQLSEKHDSPNDGGQHRSERGRARQLGNQAECGSRSWTCLHCRHVLSPAPALSWPGRALRRSVWALTAQQLVRTPACTVLRLTAAERMFAPGQNGQIGCCATQDRADWRAHQLLGRQSPDTTPKRATRPGQCGSWTQNVPEIPARPSLASALGLVAELSNAAPLQTMLTAIVRRVVFFT